jgi:hypothetical protein
VDPGESHARTGEARPQHVATASKPNINFAQHPCKSITNAFQEPSLIAELILHSAAMASGRDVREMLGLPMGGDAPKATIQKRPKPVGGNRKIRTSWPQLANLVDYEKA